MRHPLDNFIAGWLDENAEAFVFLADDENNDSDGVAEVRGELNITALVHAIEERFAIVELPAPQHSDAKGTVWEYCNADDRHRRVMATSFEHAQIVIGSGQFQTVESARALAAALLAAANRAEAQA